MYCPKCSQPQVTEETRFCSHCGLSLNNLKEIVSAGGLSKTVQAKESAEQRSPRQKGLRQGVFLILLSVVLIPAYILLAPLFSANDRLVESAVSDTPFEKISQTILLTIFMLGLARTLYARFFQAGASDAEGESDPVQLRGAASHQALPPVQGIPVAGFGSWRANTGEIAKPASVTEHTTKSLDR
ncbi:MAG: zinc ribbon domain-containing protein [Acidobacteriota bacterium]